MTYIQGFGNEIDQQGLNGLLKALEAGYQVGANKTGGSALRVESLESSLKTLTYTHQQIKFWKKIPKSPAFSTIEEYNVVSDYGGYATPFVLEGEIPQGSDSSYARKFAKIKYMGTTREVTLQATLVSTAHGDAVAQQNAEGILHLLRQVEHFLFFGDSKLAGGGEGPQWDGLDAQIDPANTMDMAGGAIEPTDFETMQNIIVENYGYATDIYWSTKAQSDLAKQMYPQHRVLIPATPNGMIGQSFDAISTMGGPVNFNPTFFLQKSGSPRPTVSSPNAPVSPASVTAGAPTGTTGNHNKGSTAGSTSYTSYVVTAANRFGESAPSPVMASAAALTPAQKDAGNYIPLTITNAANVGAMAPDFFRIYRSKSGVTNAVPTSLTDYALVAQVPAGSALPNGTTTFNDLNLMLPGTSQAFIGEFTPQVLTFRQLAPLLKQDYAVVGPSFRWAILLFGCPIVFAPKKLLRVLNIGDLVTP